MLTNNQYQSNDVVENDIVSLKDLIFKFNEWINYLLSKWKVILFFGLLGGGLGIGYSFVRNPIYIATSTFVLEEGDKGGGLGQYAGLASMVGIDLGGGGDLFQGDNIIELYKSRKMVQSTLLSRVQINGKQELLIDRYIAFNNLREKWASKPKLKGISFDLRSDEQFTRIQDSILREVVKDIKLNYLSITKPDKKLAFIKVDVKSKDELFSEVFNDQIVKNVNDFYIRTKTKKSLQNVNILQQKVDSVRSIMNGAIYSAASIIDATPNLNQSRQIQRVVPVQRSQFTAETNKLILAELVKNLEMSKIALRKETPLVQIVDKPILPLEVEKVGKFKGLIFGGLLGGFLILIYLFITKFISDTLKK